MTLILKSNTAMVAKKRTALTSTAVLALDFQTAQYEKNGVKIDSLDGVIKTTSIGSRGYYSPFGEYRTASGNVNVVSTDVSTFKRGLLVEAGASNYFKNSSAPVSQTVTVGTDSKSLVVISMFGSGSLSVVYNSSTFNVVEGQPMAIPSTLTETSHTLVITVVGDVEYVGVERTLNRERVTRITTGASIVSTKAATVELDPAILTSLLTDFEGCVVIKQHIPNNITDKGVAGDYNIPLVCVLDSALKGIYLREGANASYDVALVTSSDSDKSFEKSNLGSRKSFTSAVNFSKTSSKAVVNGTMIGDTTFAPVALSRLFLGSSPSQWYLSNTNYIQEVLLFNRQLTEDELIEVTRI